MASPLPYLASNKNLPTLFDNIKTAKIPDTFSQSFMQTTIGLKGSNDRPMIPLLRNFGFIDQANVPTATYRRLKGDERKIVLADGIRKAYSPLFDADQNAHRLSGERLKNLIAQVSGTDDDMTARIAGTFSALTKIADFETSGSSAPNTEPEKEDSDGEDDGTNGKARTRSKVGLRPEFHYNIQVHLPSNGTEEVYLNIFNALRKTFQ